MAYQVQQGRQSEYDCRYWLPEYDSCCGSYWGDDLFSGGRYSSDDDGCNERMVKTEPASLFDMCYLYPVSDPDSLPQDMAYQVQQGRQSEYDCRYWLPEYDSCCGSYWGDDLFSGGRYNSDDDGCNERMVKTEDSNQSEGQYQSYTSYCEDEFSQPDCDYNP